MRKLLSSVVALGLVAAPLFAFADQTPHRFTNFSRGAVLGEVGSTQQLQTEFNKNYTMLAAASESLGLTSDDIANVREQIDDGLARYVMIPRHLDGMSAIHGGVPVGIHNVEIPNGVYGWEVDIPKHDQTLQVYIPNRCGNVSYIRAPRRELAAAPIERTQPLMQPLTPAPALAFEASPEAVPTPEAVALAPIPVPVVAAAAPHLAWLGALLIPVLFHGGGSATISGPRLAPPTPTPIHTICPPAVVH